MPSLRHIASLLALSVLPSVALENAKDLVSIKNNTVLLADITSIHPDGTVTLNSPLSEAPLTIRPNALEQIVFKKSKPIEHDHKERIYLKNGDNLPCTLISLDDKNATFTTWYADKFSIPRDQILSISFDNKAESILFSSPHDVAKWKKNENWKSEENALKINGRGIASNSFELPANFIIDFSLEWSGLNPRFKCNFCGNDASTGHSERYFLDFNTAGVQITRG